MRPDPRRESSTHADVVTVDGTPISLALTAAEVVELAELLMDENKFAFASRVLKAALEVYPKETSILRDAGTCMVELGRGSEAIALLRKAAELDLMGDAWIELGWAAITFHDHDTAKEAIILALQRRPENLTEIYANAPMWDDILYDHDVRRAMERAEGKMGRPHEHGTICGCDRSR